MPTLVKKNGGIIISLNNQLDNADEWQNMMHSLIEAVRLASFQNECQTDGLDGVFRLMDELCDVAFEQS